MRATNAFTVLVAAAAMAAGSPDYGSDTPTAVEKPAKMSEPMETKMMKPGMKIGDVKKAAEKKERELMPTIKKESATSSKK